MHHLRAADSPAKFSWITVIRLRSKQAVAFQTWKPSYGILRSPSTHQCSTLGLTLEIQPHVDERHRADPLFNGGLHNALSFRVRLEEVFFGISHLAIFPSAMPSDKKTLAGCTFTVSSPQLRVGDYTNQQQKKWLNWARAWIKYGIKPNL
ncbi:hypothetical protein PSPO01_13060 [Paraphaeosphaeria sporulosa]